MPNGYPPFKKTVNSVGLTLISSRMSRRNLKLKNVSGTNVGITTKPDETSFANCYPLLANEAEEFPFNNNVYAIAESGSADIWAIEVE